jgi:hypothetical protein
VQPAPPPNAAAARRLHDLGRLVEALFADGAEGTLILSHHGGQFTATWSGGGVRTACRADLRAALRAAAGERPEKHCPGCDRTLAVGQFPPDPRAASGVQHLCRACQAAEMRRVRSG